MSLVTHPPNRYPRPSQHISTCSICFLLISHVLPHSSLVPSYPYKNFSSFVFFFLTPICTDVDEGARIMRIAERMKQAIHKADTEKRAAEALSHLISPTKDIKSKLPFNVNDIKSDVVATKMASKMISVHGDEFEADANAPKFCATKVRHTFVCIIESILSAYIIHTPSQYIFSSYPINTFYQPTQSIHPINPPYRHIFPTYLLTISTPPSPIESRDLMFLCIDILMYLGNL